MVTPFYDLAGITLNGQRDDDLVAHLLPRGRRKNGEPYVHYNENPELARHPTNPMLGNAKIYDVSMGEYLSCVKCLIRCTAFWSDGRVENKLDQLPHGCYLA